MKLNTKNFGVIELNEEKIIKFSNGIPGFESEKYVLLKNKEDKLDPFFWLQSVDDPDLALVLINPFIFYPHYSPEIKDEYVEDLDFETQEELTVYNVVVIPEDIKRMTVNLKAPILINANLKKGKQVISENKEYNIRHYIYEDVCELNKKIEEDKKKDNKSKRG